MWRSEDKPWESVSFHLSVDFRNGPHSGLQAWAAKRHCPLSNLAFLTSLFEFMSLLLRVTWLDSNVVNSIFCY